VLMFRNMLIDNGNASVMDNHRREFPSFPLSISGAFQIPVMTGLVDSQHFCGRERILLFFLPLKIHRFLCSTTVRHSRVGKKGACKVLTDPLAGEKNEMNQMHKDIT